MVTKIDNNLYLGNMAEARDWKYARLCVLEKIEDCEIKKSDDYWIPVVRHKNHSEESWDYDWCLGEDIEFVPERLEEAAKLINDQLKLGKPFLIGCMAATERSPIVAAYYISKKRSIPFDDAYAYIKQIHPQTQDRTTWLPPEYRYKPKGFK